MTWHMLNDDMRAQPEELRAPPPILTKVILPMPLEDLDRYAALCGRIEDLEEEIQDLERKLRLAKMRKDTCDIEICQILARRIK